MDDENTKEPMESPVAQEEVGAVRGEPHPAWVGIFGLDGRASCSCACSRCFQVACPRHGSWCRRCGARYCTIHGDCHECRSFGRYWP
jgi:hypothetical protein